MKEGNQSTMAVLANDNKIYEANEMNNVILLKNFYKIIKIKKRRTSKRIWNSSKHISISLVGS